ncbi:MAG TPA: 1-deoxy-D-xylulose-5-phosphate synthase [Oscillospiraceae bacterium]|nr:1-deoxy-D-xylulose-5-phosphate synthase [Oscillospiraceae bacterium]
MDYILNKINSPDDLKSLSIAELNELCDEIRKKIIRTVASNGGHLASNLGVVELTVALHRVFDVPQDQIVWDVGHQSYTHKILTGRREKIGTIRTQNGISGYPNRRESPYDAFNAGHSSTSISAAFGIASAKKISDDSGHVIAVIGDGALTGGLAYEGLNNAGRFNKNFIVILNDNKMSISRNVGSMARYLAHIRTKPGYLKVKGNVESVVDKIPIIGKPLHRILKRCKKMLKQALYSNTLFEDLGFTYYGPFDGHDLKKLIDVLENAKNINHPVLLHVITSKGKGYTFAEKNPGAFHGISGFNVKTGEMFSSGENFSSVFGKYLCDFARKDQKICAITAAMQTGTCLTDFKNEFPNNFFDVGIAEAHAITFAGGLASGGMLPVCAIYSSFLQRGFDQIIHDGAIQNVKIVLAIDRAGVVGEDGETHQGIFDVSFLNSVPNVTVFSPSYYEELYSDLYSAFYDCEGIVAVRYPRGKQGFKPFDFQCSNKAFDLYGDKDAKVLLVTYGRLFSFACQAKSKLIQNNINLKIIKLNRIKPIDLNAVAAAADAEKIFFFEENIQQGGVGEHFSYLLSQSVFAGKYYLRGIDNTFVKQATMLQSLADLGLDEKGMVNTIITECKK